MKFNIPSVFESIPLEPSYEDNENPPPLKLDVVEFPELDLWRVGRSLSSKMFVERDMGGR